MLGGQIKKSTNVALLNHREHGVPATIEIRGQPFVEGSEALLDRAQQENIEVACKRGIAEADDVAIGRECGDAVDPRLGGNKLEFRLQNDPSRSPGMEDEADIIAFQGEDPRLFFNRHYVERLDHAGIA